MALQEQRGHLKTVAYKYKSINTTCIDITVQLKQNIKSDN